MRNNEKIYSFLESNGFNLIKDDMSSFFGDYYKIFNKTDFQLKFTGSKSFEAVDIRSNLPDEDWYDLVLVKALFYDEKDLNKITSIEDHESFLLKEFNSILELFNDKNYPNTKARLEKLGDERMKQMFPRAKI